MLAAEDLVETGLQLRVGRARLERLQVHEVDRVGALVHQDRAGRRENRRRYEPVRGGLEDRRGRGRERGRHW